MNAKESNLVALTFIAVLIVGVTVLDFRTPSGVAVWLFYLVPLMVAATSRSSVDIFIVAGICSCLTIIGLFASPTEIPFSTALTNRAMGISVLWIVGGMQALHIKSELRLRQSDERLRYASTAAGIRTWHRDVKQTARVYDDRGIQLFPQPQATEGITLSYLDYAPPEEREHIEESARSALHQRKDYAAEVQVVLPDGTKRWILEKGRGFYDQRGKPLCMHGIAMDITEQKRAEDNLRQLMLHKDILMKELQHRVKNSLALVSGLLGLEIPNLPDTKAKEVFSETCDRIGAVSRIYSLLYQSEGVNSVNLRRYLTEVAQSLFGAYADKGSEVHLACALDETDLDTKRAVPLGLILNELITNALKHAFPDSKGGIVRVVLRRSEKELVLGVLDNGVGFPLEFNPAGATTMGMSLVRMLADEINGTLSVEGTGGAQVSVRMPL
jgi:two-component sensor histidine kinase/PAS domain-containing protein